MAITKKERKVLIEISERIGTDQKKIMPMDAKELRKDWMDFQKVKEALFLTLCIQGDEDGDCELLLDDLLEEWGA